MADAIAAHRAAHPDARVLFVVGAFHVAGRLGAITKYVARRPNDRVAVLDEDTGEKVKYKIVGEFEANVRLGKVSIASPIARALIGKSKGETAEVTTPKGSRSYAVVKIEWNEPLREKIPADLRAEVETLQSEVASGSVSVPRGSF